MTDIESRPSGLLNIYVSNIQSLSGGTKISKIRSRTPDTELIVLNETNRKADDDVQIGVRFGKVSNTPNPDRTGPGFGTFVGSRTFDAN